MEKDEAVELLQQERISSWNQYRGENPNWVPDLSGIVFSGNLAKANLAGANLCGSDLSRAKLHNANSFREASASRAILTKAIYDIKTKFPIDVDPAEAGAIYVSQAAKREDKSRSSVFISYAWANDDVVLAVDAWLRRKGLVTKLDKRDFFAGARIRDEIVRVMAQCDIILFFYSRDAAEKPWPEFERELAEDLRMTEKKAGRQPPRSIYVVIDDVALPSISEENKIAVFAKGKRFELVCEELYHSILELPRSPTDIDLGKWSDFVF